MRSEATQNPGKLTRLWSRPVLRLQLLALTAGLGVVIGVTVVSLLNADITDVEYWKALGYPGVFFFSLFGSGTMVFPLPGLVAVCGAGGLELNLIGVGLLAGTGETIGELTGYAIGYGGRGVVQRRRLYYLVRLLMIRRGVPILFLVSLIPNPLFDVVGIAAGATRFPLTRFLATVWIGKTLKSLMVAYACFQGYQLLPWVS